MNDSGRPPHGHSWRRCTTSSNAPTMKLSDHRGPRLHHDLLLRSAQAARLSASTVSSNRHEQPLLGGQDYMFLNPGGMFCQACSSTTCSKADRATTSCTCLIVWRRQAATNQHDRQDDDPLRSGQHGPVNHEAVQRCRDFARRGRAIRATRPSRRSRRLSPEQVRQAERHGCAVQEPQRAGHRRCSATFADPRQI